LLARQKAVGWSEKESGETQNENQKDERGTAGLRVVKWSGESTQTRKKRMGPQLPDL